MSEFQQGLVIAAIGMGLVFGVISFLWGLMVVILRVTTRDNQKKEHRGSQGLHDPSMNDIEAVEGQRRAAAAAVGVELALAASKPAVMLRCDQDFSGELSPWQSFHRTRQLGHKKTQG